MIRWLTTIIAKRKLARDVALRRDLVGREYGKRRSAALKGAR